MPIPTPAQLFPIMCGERVADHKSWIPWEVIAPHEAQAQRNHSQTLQRLAERGGLAPCEAVAVLEDRDWRRMPQHEARVRLGELVAAILLQRVQEIADLETVCDKAEALIAAQAQEIEQVKALLREHLQQADFGDRNVNYCWFCGEDVNGRDGTAKPHAENCLGVRSDAALVSRAPQQEQA